MTIATSTPQTNKETAGEEELKEEEKTSPTENDETKEE